MRRVVLLLCLLCAVAYGQDTPRLTAGFGELVAGAWNHIAVQGRDLAGHTLRLDIELGTLREQARYKTYEFHFPAGRGNVVLEQSVFVPADARTIAWRILADTRTVHSGQLDIGPRGHLPMVLLVGVAPADFPEQPRTERVAAHELPSDPTAYDGVAAIVLSGTSVAPSLEAITAAAAMGTAVFFPPNSAPSYQALSQLASHASDGLGAGAVHMAEATPEALANAVAQWHERVNNVGALLASTPSLPPLPLTGAALLLVLVGYLALARALAFVRGVPGIASIVLLVVVASGAVIISMRGTEQSEHTDYLRAASGGLQRVDEVHVVHKRGGIVDRTYYPPRVERLP